MGIQLAVLEVAFTSSGAGKVQSDIAGVGSAIDDTAAHTAGGMATAAGAAGLLADAFLGVSVKAASSFQSMMTQIQNNTTLTNGDMVQLEASVKSMAQQSGASLDQLGQAYMHATNFGFDFATSQKIVEAGMQSAVSTGGSVSDTVNVLAGAMKEFGISGDQAANAMDVLHEAAATGNMTLEQLVESSGKMLSTAANLHVPLTDVAAGMATLTEHGFTAANAGVAMTNMMTKIIAPSAGAQKEIAALSKATGIDLVHDFTSAGLAAKGMPAILDDISKATGGNADVLHKLFPELRAFQGALALTGTAADDYTRELDLMQKAMEGKITPTADAYKRTLATLGNEMDRFGKSIQVLAIDIGSVLLPPLAAIAGFAADAAAALANLADGHPKLVAAILAVVGALGTFIGGMAAMEALSSVPFVGGIIAGFAPLIVTFATVAAAAAALYLAWDTNFLGIRGVFEQVWASIQPGLAALTLALHEVGMALAFAFKGDWSEALSLLGDGVQAALRGLGSIGGSLWKDIQKPNWGSIFGDVGSDIVTALKAGGSISVRLAEWLAHEVANIPWATVWGGIKTAGSAVLSGLTKGANITAQLAQWLAGQVANLPWGTVWAGIQSAGGAILSGLETGADITAQLAEWLAGQVASIPWARVWSGITSAGSAIASGLEKGANIAAELGTWLAGEVGKVDWSAVWSNVKAAGSDLVDGLEKGADVTGQLTTWLKNQVAGIDWSAIWGDTKSGASNIGSMFSNIDLSGVTTQVKSLGDAVGHAVEHNSEAQALVGALKDAAAADVSKVGSFFSAVGDAVAKIAASPAAAQLLDQVSKSAAQIGSAGGPAVDILKTLGDALAKIGEAAGSQAVSDLEGIAKALGAIGAVVLTGILTGLGTLIDLLSAGVPGAEKAAEGVLQTLSGVIETVSSAISGVVKVADDLLHGDWTKAWNDAKTAVSGVVDGIVTIVSGIGTTLQGILETGLALVKQVFVDAWHAVFIVVTGAIGDLETVAGTIGSRIVDAVGDLSTTLFSAGKAVIQGLIDGIGSMLKPLGDALGAIGGFITSHKGPPSYDAVMLVPAGQAIVGGLIDGLTSMNTPLAAAAGALGQAVLGALSGGATAQVVSDTQETTGSIVDLYTQAADAVLVQFDRVGKGVKDITSQNVTALSDMFKASEDIFKNNQTLLDLASGNVAGDHHVVTQQMIADDQTRAASAKTLAEALVQQSNDAAQRVIADYQAIQAAGGEGANAQLDAQLKADQGIAQAVQQLADAAVSSWKSATTQMVRDTNAAATQIKDALKAVQTTTADIGKNDQGLVKSLLGDNKSSPLTITPGQTAADQTAQAQAATAAITASAAADAAYKTLLADQQAYYAALQAGNLDLANSINARIPAEQAAADAARQAAQAAQQASTDASATVKSDIAAQKAATADLAQFDISQTIAKTTASINGHTEITAAQRAQEVASLASVQAQSAMYEKMYQAVVAAGQQAYATLLRGETGLEAAIKSGDTVAQQFYTNMINKALQNLDLDEQQRQAILALEKTLKEGIPTSIQDMTDGFKSADEAAKKLNATLDQTAKKAETAAKSVADIAQEAAKQLSESFARDAFQDPKYLNALAEMYRELRSTQGYTDSLGRIAGSPLNPQPIVVEAHLYLDGEQLTHSTTTVMSKQLRMNAPLVGADRVRN